jgi:hypothetical protein
MEINDDDDDVNKNKAVVFCSNTEKEVITHYKISLANKPVTLPK